MATAVTQTGRAGELPDAVLRYTQGPFPSDALVGPRTSAFASRSRLLLIGSLEAMSAFFTDFHTSRIPVHGPGVQQIGG
jgi:hypothetical protein